MAPDLNSVPPSPRPSLAASPRLASRSTSRRTSTQMPPPALPPSSPSFNILSSNQTAVNQTSPRLASPTMPMASPTGAPALGDNTGVGAGPGPLRHPRPLTAADLHLQLEKEQEAVVRTPQFPTFITNTKVAHLGQPTYTRTIRAPSSNKMPRSYPTRLPPLPVFLTQMTTTQTTCSRDPRTPHPHNAGTTAHPPAPARGASQRAASRPSAE